MIVVQQPIVITSARLAANLLLYVRPLSCHFKFLVCVYRGRVCPGSVGTRQALLQGWLLCVGFVCLANVPDLVYWLLEEPIVFVNQNSPVKKRIEFFA